MALSFCPNCGARRLPEAGYCGSCGHDFGTGSAAAPSPNNSPPAPVATQGAIRWQVLAAVAVAVVLVATGGVYALGRLQGSHAALPHGPSTPVGAAPSATTATGSFAQTGSLVIARFNNSATPLLDGRVLVAGGEGGVGRVWSDVATAELYDAATGTFSRTGTMVNGRVWHFATRLLNGGVLIGGGDGVFNNGYTPLASVELYDPATGAFSPTGSMTTDREFPTATLLSDGRVLVAGGDNPYSACSILASTEVYDPTTGTFNSGATMEIGREGQTATLLKNGLVLIAGGSGGCSAQSSAIMRSAELYDPRVNSFQPTGSLVTARSGQTATLLRDGRVLITGGCAESTGQGCTAVASAELYDPTSGTFSPTGSMSEPRVGHAATLLPDGRVLIAGGCTREDNGCTPLTSAEIYDPRTGTFSPTGPMLPGRAGFTLTALETGGVLVTGNDSPEAGPIATAEVYR